MKKDFKVAIVCDWLTGIGGAERVVYELHKMFPEAPIYTSQYDPKKASIFKDADVRTLWLQKLPASLKKFLPVLRASAFSRLDLSEYDLVLSATGAEAKAVKIGPNTIHICYCFAPTHYYWSRYDQYIRNPGFGKLNWLARFGLSTLVGPMRRWDKKAASRPTHMVGISTHIVDEIKKYYGRDAELIHPPVDIERFKGLANVIRGNKYVITGRQTSYKCIDLAVAACTKLALPLTVIGDGPEHEKLINISGPTIEFKTGLTDAQVNQYLAESKAFLFPGLDDFGIAAVEAMAAGTPVIAYKAGGALDYVDDGKSGLFFEKQDVDSLIEAIRKFDRQDWDRQTVVKKAVQFDNASFNLAMRELINKKLA